MNPRISLRSILGKVNSSLIVRWVRNTIFSLRVSGLCGDWYVLLSKLLWEYPHILLWVSAKEPTWSRVYMIFGAPNYKFLRGPGINEVVSIFMIKCTFNCIPRWWRFLSCRNTPRVRVVKCNRKDRKGHAGLSYSLFLVSISMFFWSLWYKLHEAIWYIFVRWCSLEWRLHIFHLEPFRIQPHHHQLRVRDTYKKIMYFRIFKKEGIWKPVFKLFFNKCSTTNRPRKECQMPFWLFQEWFFKNVAMMSQI